MKKYVMIMITALSLMLSVGELQAQKKKVVKKSTAKTHTVKFVEKSFGTPTSITEVTDITDASPGYDAEKNLIENYGVTLAYSDNTFKGKEPLRRGDFIVAFNSALSTIKKAMDSSAIDSSMINTYDKNASYITSVNDLKDLQPTSVYYPATQALIERWGIAAPFTKAKVMNAGGVMTEAEVYDILKVTLGYTSPGSNPYTTAMSREKFAMVLNNAMNQKMSQITAMATDKRMAADAERRRQELAFQASERQRKDSVAKEIELRRIDAQRKEAEAWSKLSDREKRKLARTQNNK
jgi:hypothetical protein